MCRMWPALWTSKAFEVALCCDFCLLSSFPESRLLPLFYRWGCCVHARPRGWRCTVPSFLSAAFCFQSYFPLLPFLSALALQALLRLRTEEESSGKADSHLSSTCWLIPWNYFLSVLRTSSRWTTGVGYMPKWKFGLDKLTRKLEGWDVAQLVDCVLSSLKALGLTPNTHQPVHVCNSSTPEASAERSNVPSHRHLQRAFEATVGYGKPYLQRYLQI